MSNILVQQKDSSTGKVSEQLSTNRAAHTLAGGAGGTANTAITSWPHTLATHTATGAGTAYNLPSGRCTVQASSDNNGGTFTSATIDIEVSNDNDLWINLGSISLSGDNDTDGFAIDAPWAYIRSNCSALVESGSTPTVNVTINI